MKPDMKDKWIKALRSGRYEQTTNELRRPPFRNVTEAFCCLGVLCSINGAEWSAWDPLVGGVDWSRMDEAYLSDAALDATGLTESEQATLSRMNDEGKSFAEIADYIETHL